MSKRTILSRPRTRVYDANYNIGESMYRPALDRLNRKYSGKPLSPPRGPATIPAEILDRHDRAFFDDDLDNCRRRAGKHIAGESYFDSRGARLDARELMDSFDDETVTRIKSIRASKKISAIDDVGMESTVNNINARRLVDRTDKILDSVGLAPLNEPVTRRGFDRGFDRELDDDVVIKRRSLRLSQLAQDEEGASSNRELTRWSALKEEQAQQQTEKTESAASFRAKQSRARLNDLDDEMEAMAERQAEREKKAARLRALIAEVAEENDIPPPVSTRRAVRIKESQEEALVY